LVSSTLRPTTCRSSGSCFLTFKLHCLVKP
jgi:hypothetical protein